MFLGRLHMAAFAALVSSSLFGCGVKQQPDTQGSATGEADQGSGSGTTTGFRVTELVTDATDPDLLNPWGLVGAEGVFWIADNHTGKVSVYDGDGKTSDEYPTGRFSLGEGITGVAALEGDEEETPTGDTDTEPTTSESEEPFLVDTGPECAVDRSPAEFVFASEEGKLIAINDDTPIEGVTVVDSSADHAVYLGVAKVDMPSGPALLAADFANARIDVFDGEFKKVKAGSAFVDPQMPEGWGPFNVMAIDETVYVAEAKIGPDGDEDAGPGLGAVALFDESGAMIGRIKNDLFNAPWGVAVAGSESDMCEMDVARTLFIGNFGDGRITQFDADTLEPIGQLADKTGKPIELEGLWGITMGSDEAGDEDALYFAQGPDDEAGGVFGRIDREE